MAINIPLASAYFMEESMRTVISIVALSIACGATADVQTIAYQYDDSDAEYTIVSFIETGSSIQATLQRSGTYFTNYTKLDIDCDSRNVRHMGMYNSLDSLEKAQFDQMEGRIVEGSIADEVGKVLCKGTTMTASQAASQTDKLPAEELPDDKT
ncbi:hypothetical protein [Pseudomonas halotolerans]|uniref:hypothetical protein n=1 Tax=Pseudomonas halotolerans TaxID=3143552 RepID=UPI0031D3BFD7